MEEETQKRPKTQLITGYNVHGYKVNAFESLVGNIMQSIEIAGLQIRQEDALKANIRHAIWRLWDNPQFSYNYESVENGEDKLII
jgi:hypothetical protein